MRKPPKGKSLAEVTPELAKEWHPNKNGELKPLDLTAKSGQKVWWKCPKGDDHEWEARIYSRSNGNNCPICSGYLIVKSNCLATTHPELSSEWHPTRNEFLKPVNVGAGSAKKVWWKCNVADDHEWQSTIINRVNGAGCPFCSGHKVANSTSLNSTNPEILPEWDYIKNKVTPKQISFGTRSKVWWKCQINENHSWQATPSDRLRGSGCPFCGNRKVSEDNSLLNVHPNIASTWHPTKNGKRKPSDVVAGSKKKVWWKCPKGDDHEWESTIYTRVTGKSNCPICSGRKTVRSNSFGANYPVKAKFWHPTKNNDKSPFSYVPNSNKKAWWKCPKGDDHEWEATIASMTREGDSNNPQCPICIGRIVVRSNCLSTVNPKLASEWHPTRNSALTPLEVVAGSKTKVWWKCPKGDDHVWEATVASRSNGNGCPVCANYLVVESNCLATLNPKLASEWHPNLNGTLTAEDVVPGYTKKVWWQCKKSSDHIWMATPQSRTAGNGCPFCTLTPQSRQELQITFELKQFFDIDPKGFKTKINGKLWTIDIYLEELNLGIEFDGNYWHKDKRSLDKLKTEKLREEGFTIMRIREEPLKRITDIDVVSKRPFNGKKVTNDILRLILEVYEIDSKRVKKMKEYFRKRKLQNEEALDKYIDQILEEKAERKRKRK